MLAREQRMYTYTTPSITLTISGLADYIANVNYIRIAIKGKAKVIREILAADFDTETESVTISLTQEETASIGNGQIAVQARIIYTDGTVQPTEKAFTTMHDIIDKVVV
jgi:hypothetical protein